MFPCLIDQGCGEHLRWIEIADRESLEPRLLTARHAMKLRAAHVPELDIDTVGATLAEQKRRHQSSLAAWRTKSKGFTFLTPTRRRRSKMRS